MSVCKIFPIYYNYLQKYEPQYDKRITRKYDIYRTAIITRIVSFLIFSYTCILKKIPFKKYMNIEKDQNFVILETKESWKENQNEK